MLSLENASTLTAEASTLATDTSNPNHPQKPSREWINTLAGLSTGIQLPGHRPLSSILTKISNDPKLSFNEYLMLHNYYNYLCAANNTNKNDEFLNSIKTIKTLLEHLNPELSPYIKQNLDGQTLRKQTAGLISGQTFELYTRAKPLEKRLEKTSETPSEKPLEKPLEKTVEVPNPILRLTILASKIIEHRNEYFAKETSEKFIGQFLSLLTELSKIDQKPIGLSTYINLNNFIQWSLIKNLCRKDRNKLFEELHTHLKSVYSQTFSDEIYQLVFGKMLINCKLRDGDSVSETIYFVNKPGKVDLETIDLVDVTKLPAQSNQGGNHSGVHFNNGNHVFSNVQHTINLNVQDLVSELEGDLNNLNGRAFTKAFELLSKTLKNSRVTVKRTNRHV